MSTTLRCPFCGAPVAPESPKCPHCGNALLEPQEEPLPEPPQPQLSLYAPRRRWFHGIRGGPGPRGPLRWLLLVLAGIVGAPVMFLWCGIIFGKESSLLTSSIASVLLVYFLMWLVNHGRKR